MKLKTSYFLSLVAVAFSLAGQERKAYITDARDGQQYQVVQIDKLLWFAENARFQTPGAIDADTLIANYRKAGLRYLYEDIDKVCPKGWRLPVRTEWASLISKNQDSIFYYIADRSGWKQAKKNILVKTLGLAVVPAEMVRIYRKGKVGWIETVSFWLDTSGEKQKYHVHIRPGMVDLHAHEFLDPDPNRFSVRCVCEAETN